MADLSELKAAVDANTSVTQSVIALITGFTDKIEHLNDEGDAQGIADEVAALRANTSALAAAVSANTPAAASEPQQQGDSPQSGATQGTTAPTPESPPSGSAS